jgi:serine/threonine-protein kinase
MPRVGDVVAGKYRIESVIGEGGMGAVFAATHTVTEKRVALKWMRPDLVGQHGAVQRFMREAQAAGRLNHPNVVDIYDIGEHDGSPFLVMEYLQGEPLGAALERALLSPQQVVRFLLPAMRGVAAAHASGVVHRDLKPDNIFLVKNPDGSVREPKVLDFGISKITSADGQINPRLTRTGAVMGTPYYMSPEQLRDAAEIDGRTDVYAFGVILYEALTGRVPFDAENYSALILEIATGTPKRPRQLRSEIPEGLERVVQKAMARDPADRYSNIESLVRSLEPFARGSSRSPRSSTDSGEQRQRHSMSVTTPFVSDSPTVVTRRRRWIGPAFAVAALVLLGAAAWAFQRGGGQGATAVQADQPPEQPAGTLLGAETKPKPSKAVQSPSPGVTAAVAADAGTEHNVEIPTATTSAASPPAAVPAPGIAVPAAPGGEHRAREQAGRVPDEAPVRARGRTGGLRTDEF